MSDVELGLLMRDFTIAYIGSCLGAYVMAWYMNPLSLRNTKLSDIFRGILGALVWPITIILLPK